MKRRTPPGEHDPHQLTINWASESSSQPNSPTSNLTLPLRWDFRTSFPSPTEQAIEAGIVSAEDTDPDGIRAIHEEHAREMLATLNDLDAVLDAKRRGVDPRNNKAPMLREAKERLQKFFATEPPRLERWFENLLGAYEDAFGDKAKQAFGKAVRAWHAGVEVVAESPPGTPASKVSAEAETETFVTKIRRRRDPNRIIARLPVPKPVASAVAAGHFGYEENGKPVHPGAHEVRAITEQHAEKLVDLLAAIAAGPASGKEALHVQFGAAIAAYAEDFGQRAADQLEAYVRRQVGLDPGSRNVR